MLAYRDDVGPAAAISRIAYMNQVSSTTFGLVAQDAKFEVIVVGAGIIGLSIAYELIAKGFRVALVDPTPGEKTSHVGAGMIAPVSETAFGEDDLTQFNLLAAASWPDFRQRLEADSNCDLEFVQRGTIAVAFNADDRRFLMDLLNYQLNLGLKASPLTNGQCLELEPSLNPRVAGGILAENDCHVNPRMCVNALLSTLNQRGATLVKSEVQDIGVKQHGSNQNANSVILENGTEIFGDFIVLATGVLGADFPSIPKRFSPPLRAIKGQILRLEANESTVSPTHVVRGMVQARPIYVVPRPSGELVVGATVEEKSEDFLPSAGGVENLLHDAFMLVPGLREANLREIGVGFRPGTRDNAPYIGKSGIESLYYAFGHFRHGIMQAPITAKIISNFITGQTPPKAAIVSDPLRDGIV